MRLTPLVQRCRRSTAGARTSAALAVLALLAACTDSATHPSLTDVRWPPLLEASDLVTIAPEPGAFRLSPDGRKIAWIGAHRGRAALFVRDHASGETRRFPRIGQPEHWTADGRWIVFEAPDRSGAENAHVFALDTEGASDAAVDLTPHVNVKARLHQLLPREPGAILVVHNRRDPKLFDLYRIDLATGKETLVSRNPGDAVAPITDPAGVLRQWQRSREALLSTEEQRRPHAERAPALTARKREHFQPLGANEDGSGVWALSSRGRDRVALVLAHPTLGWERVVFEDPHVDVTDVDMSQVQRAPLVARALPGHPRFEILDARLKQDLAPLIAEQGGTPFTLAIASTDAAERRLVIAVRSATSRRFYLLDREDGSHLLLSEAIPARLRAALAPVEPVRFDASDGRTLHGYLTLPAGVAPKTLPLVLLIHGGPWQRTAWGDPLAGEEAALTQFLASRGYAVLAVDFRGSAGYGREHLYAGVGEFAGRMQQDLHDAVRWAAGRGIADPGHVALVGWSYGGYATMVGLTMTPKAFACGVSLYGPTDLASLIESFPPYWQVDLSMWHDFVGNPAVAADRAAMTQKSPLTHAASMERPLLLVHGTNDVRVRIDQAERMVAALHAAGRPVEYLRIDDMGHATGWWVHRVKVLRATERFLHDCLGGRASRLDPWDPVAWAWERIQR